jgi:hypothetical protein
MIIEFFQIDTRNITLDWFRVFFPQPMSFIYLFIYLLFIKKSSLFFPSSSYY